MSATTTMERPETSMEMPGISSVIVFLDRRGGTRNGVHLAADAARRQHASLHAVYLDARPPGLSHDQARDIEIAAGRAREAENVARAAAGKFDVPFEWDIDAGDTARMTRKVIDRARTSDLIVVDWGTLSESGGDWAMELFAQLPLLSGRPTLFVPARHRANTFGENALVAWNASRESARAVHDALPLLESARDVTVLGVETARDQQSAEPGGEPHLAAYLSRHGIRVRLCTSYVVGPDTGETIASRARELDSDLLVMGARGHGRLGRVVLGRATRYLLENMPVPVLMSH
jgi:nucleotide-binding universal stress UspA family protein